MPTSKPVWVIIPASGKGLRMAATIPKQYLKFQQKTILEHCLDRLLSHPLIAGAVVVINEADSHWAELGYRSDKPVLVAEGGEERMHSVFNGLSLLQALNSDASTVLVHDAVRPLVSHQDIDALIDAAEQNSGGAILATPVTDTIKRQGDNLEIAKSVPREGLWRALTPQAFELKLLQRALGHVIENNLMVTDDASAVELLGHHPGLVLARADNIKITNREDLALAETIWLNQLDQHNDK
jgi:2-C-methyl-D-erythritol 4-phosphate cytidylyltransferase